MNQNARLPYCLSAGRWVIALSALFVLGLFFLLAGQAVGSTLVITTPLQLNGLSPIWQENFANGSLDRMQYAWPPQTASSADANSFIVTGTGFNAAFIGNLAAADEPTQQLNNFKATAGEALPSTIEFDVYSPYDAFGPIGLRPRRTGDEVSLILGKNVEGDTQINYTDGFTQSVSTLSGVTGKWDHVVVSYRQEATGDPNVTTAHYVVAINNTVQEHSHTSTITPTTWAAYYATWPLNEPPDGWSLKFSTLANTAMGKYVANVRAYSDFLDTTNMTAKIAGVLAYRDTLAAPTGPSGKSFKRSLALSYPGPYALAYWSQRVPSDTLTVDFDGTLSSGYQKILTYTWSYGDGATGSGRTPNHQYASPGVYNVNLSVTMKLGSNNYTFPINVMGPSGPQQSIYLPLIMR